MVAAQLVSASIRKHSWILQQKSLLHLQRVINLPASLTSAIQDHRKQAEAIVFPTETFHFFFNGNYHILLRFIFFKLHRHMQFWSLFSCDSFINSTGFYSVSFLCEALIKALEVVEQ